MSISNLKTNRYLPISETIAHLFTPNGPFYTLKGVYNPEIDDGMTLYDDTFALINSIELDTIDNNCLTTLLVENEDSDYEELQYTSKVNVTQSITKFTWKISKVVKRIKLPNPSAIVNIRNITIKGQTLGRLQNTFDSLIEDYDSLDEQWSKQKNQLAQHKATLEKIIDDIVDKDFEREALDENLTTLGKAVDEVTRQKKQLEGEKEELEKNVEIKRELLGDITVQVDRTQLELANTRSEVVEVSKKSGRLKEELRQLEVEKYRYSEDFDSFKRELSLQNMLFLALTSLFILIGSSIAYSLIEGSHNLLIAFNSGVNIYELIISRIPSVLIHSLIIFFLGKWLGLLIEGLMSNLRDLKKLKQLVYLVTEVTESQALGLEESQIPGSRYRQRVCEKMSIVRDALSIPSTQDVEKSDKGKVKEMSEAAGNTLRVMAGR